MQKTSTTATTKGGGGERKRDAMHGRDASDVPGVRQELRRRNMQAAMSRRLVHGHDNELQT